MDFNVIIIAIVLIAAIFLVMKFVINPVLKLISGALILFVILYILKYYFQVNFNELLGPLGRYVDLEGFLSSINQAVRYISSYLEKFQ